MIAGALSTFAFAVATWVFGWVGVPAVALVVGWSRRTTRPVVTAAVSAALAWAALLALGGIGGPVGGLASLLGEILGVWTGAVFVITLAYPAALAASAAAVSRSVRDLGVAGPPERATGQGA